MSLADEVKRAQAGDRFAFARLVERFQDLAVGYAIGWLGDPESARDAAQDAFIEAYLHLHQLEEPAAFVAWFRRIVIKHCDRRTRRKPLPELDPPTMPALVEDELSRREERDWLRRAIEALPEHERIVVALHYLGDEPQQDVADFLELPLSTVKKRLHSARKRLEARRTDMEGHRPSKERVFSDRIQLFLAIRAGDTELARTILDGHPALTEAEERWTTEEALDGGFPLAHRMTPLILASSHGDRAMVEMLLAKGAQTDASCGCDNGETALWSAVLHGRTGVVQVLLAAGADPDPVNEVGHSPLHLAAMRGHEELTQLLLQHGAEKERRAKNGMTPGEYRAQRTSTGARFETGIKAIDLFAPLGPGIAVRVQGAAETGLTVLLAELARRFGDAGLRSVFATQASRTWELETLVAQLGIADCTQVVTGVFDPSAHAAAALFVFQSEGHEAQIEAALPRMIEHAAITFVIEPWIPVTRGEREPPALRAPYAAVIRTSPELAQEGIYPAIDPNSDSSVEVRPEHARIRDSVRELLSRGGPPAGEAKRFLAQPFFTWQHQNGRPGEVVPLRETLEYFATLRADGA